MSLQDAANLIQIQDARERILQDPSLSPWEQGKFLYALNQAKDFQPKPSPLITGQQFVQGAIGAGLGLGVARLATRWLSLPDAVAAPIQAAGAGLGSLMNLKTSHVKIAEVLENHERDTRAAFRIGFLKQAAMSGLLKTAGPVLFPIPTLPLTPETVGAPIRAALGLFNRGIEGAGSLAGNLDAADSTDQSVLRMEAERQALDRRAEVLEAKRTNRLLGQLLARRRSGATSGA
ncbi:MAG: hypothetical protein K2Q20_08760 [Phycisphaerales bacterium]|nr:hypothetical protein [Phycisphaerales bacterium]